MIAGRAAASYGPVARMLALLARVDGRVDDAERHFNASLALSEGMGDRPFTARARHELALMLLDRDRPGDRERALELLGAALDSAQELGMVGLVERGARGAASRPGARAAGRRDLDRLPHR